MNFFKLLGLFGQNLRNGPEGPKGSRMKALFHRTPLCLWTVGGRILKILNRVGVNVQSKSNYTPDDLMFLSQASYY